jgi:hypothetical protein
LEEACHDAVRRARDDLLAMAVARGCDHYRPFLLPEIELRDDGDIPNEILACALMRGPRDAPTFQAIRCGAMVLSDLDNSPEAVAQAAHVMGVSNRVRHVAKVALSGDRHPEYWRHVLDLLTGLEPDSESEFLPSVSRLTSETHWTRAGRGVRREWLRIGL